MYEEIINVVPVSEEFPYYKPKEGTKPMYFKDDVPYYRRSDVEDIGISMGKDECGEKGEEGVDGSDVEV